MDHDFIDENAIVDRYIVGTLSPEEEIQFESHYLDCSLCLDALSVSGALQEGLQAETLQRAVEATVAARGIAAWLQNPARLRMLAMGLMIGVVALMIPLLSSRQQLRELQLPAADNAVAVRLEKTRSTPDNSQMQILTFPAGENRLVIKQSVRLFDAESFRIDLVAETGRSYPSFEAVAKDGFIHVRLYRGGTSEGVHTLTLSVPDGDGWSTADQFQFKIRKD